MTSDDIDQEIQRLLAQKAAGLTPLQVQHALDTCSKDTTSAHAKALHNYPAGSRPPVLQQTEADRFTIESRSNAAAHPSSGHLSGPPTLGHFASLPRKSQNANIESHPLNNFFGIDQSFNSNDRGSLDAILTGGRARPGSWMGKRSYVESQASAAQRTLPLNTEENEQGWRTAPFLNAKKAKTNVDTSNEVRKSMKSGFETENESSTDAVYNSFFKTSTF
jgi:hypothetical protein